MVLSVQTSLKRCICYISWPTCSLTLTCVAMTTWCCPCRCPRKVYMFHLLANSLAHVYMHSHDHLGCCLCRCPSKGVWVPNLLANSFTHVYICSHLGCYPCSVPCKVCTSHLPANLLTHEYNNLGACASVPWPLCNNNDACACAHSTTRQ